MSLDNDPLQTLGFPGGSPPPAALTPPAPAPASAPVLAPPAPAGTADSEDTTPPPPQAIGAPASSTPQPAGTTDQLDLETGGPLAKPSAPPPAPTPQETIAQAPPPITLKGSAGGAGAVGSPEYPDHEPRLKVPVGRYKDLEEHNPTLYEAVNHVADDVGIPRLDLAALVYANSDNDPNARDGNRVGYMGVTPDDVQRYDPDGHFDPSNPIQNLYLGALKYKQLAMKYGRGTADTFAAYYAGEGTVDAMQRRHGDDHESIAPHGTFDFVNRVVGRDTPKDYGGGSDDYGGGGDTPPVDPDVRNREALSSIASHAGQLVSNPALLGQVIGRGARNITQGAPIPPDALTGQPTEADQAIMPDTGVAAIGQAVGQVAQGVAQGFAGTPGEEAARRGVPVEQVIRERNAAAAASAPEQPSPATASVPAPAPAGAGTLTAQGGVLQPATPPASPALTAQGGALSQVPAATPTAAPAPPSSATAPDEQDTGASAPGEPAAATAPSGTTSSGATTAPAISTPGATPERPINRVSNRQSQITPQGAVRADVTGGPMGVLTYMSRNGAAGNTVGQNWDYVQNQMAQYFALKGDPAGGMHAQEWIFRLQHQGAMQSLMKAYNTFDTDPQGAAQLLAASHAFANDGAAIGIQVQGGRMFGQRFSEDTHQPIGQPFEITKNGIRGMINQTTDPQQFLKTVDEERKTNETIEHNQALEAHGTEALRVQEEIAKAQQANAWSRVQYVQEQENVRAAQRDQTRRDLNAANQKDVTRGQLNALNTETANLYGDQAVNPPLDLGGKEMTPAMKDLGSDLYFGLRRYNSDTSSRMVQDIVRSLVAPSGTAGAKYRVDPHPVAARDNSGQPWYAVIDAQGRERAYLPHSVLRTILPNTPAQQAPQQAQPRLVAGSGP